MGHKASNEVRRILIVSPTWLGDAVMALPALKRLRQCHPAAELIVLSKPQLLDLWQLTQIPDQIIPQVTGSRGTFKTARILSKLGIDGAYIIPNSFRSALIVKIAGIPERIGFRGHFRSALLTEIRSREFAQDSHQSVEIMGLFSDDRISTVDFSEPLIDIDNDVAANVRSKFSLADNLVALIPGAARGPSKCWPEGSYVALGKMIAAAGRPVAVLGTAAESELCGRVAAAIGPGARSLAGETSLLDLAALLKVCAALVANDSGGMHLAAAVGTPVVAIYGITDPDKTGPLGKNCLIMQNSGVKDRNIPRDSHLARKCLESISAEAVYSALEKSILATQNPG